jgi:hypothetical protein
MTVRTSALRVTLLSCILAGCSAGPSEAVGAASSSIVSATTTYLLPVDDGVRAACRSTWTNGFCVAGDAKNAGDACVAAYVASGASPACASSAQGCFELFTADTPCTADGPIYPTPASCLAPVERTCAFYSACVEANKPCGASGYAIGYGEKYCSRFDVDDTFSPEGKVWRDATLHCLQEALVPELGAIASMSCDAITTFAFDSHPACYTDHTPSFCFLPPADIANVLGTIDGKDLLSLRSAQQMATVAATCVEQIVGAIFAFHERRDDARLPRRLRDEAAIEDQLRFWQSVQAHGVPGSSR